jgi:hypothetical protein
MLAPSTAEEPDEDEVKLEEDTDENNENDDEIA